MQRRPNVFDVGPTLHKSYTNMFCLLGKLEHTTYISLFRIRKAEIVVTLCYASCGTDLSISVYYTGLL